MPLSENQKIPKSVFNLGSKDEIEVTAGIDEVGEGRTHGTAEDEWKPDRSL